MNVTIPMLGVKSYTTSPKEMLAEILHNYVRGSVRQSMLFKTRSFLNDMANTNNNIEKQKSTIQSSLEYLVSRAFNVYEVILHPGNEPIVSITVKYEDVPYKLENINLNELVIKNINSRSE